MRNFRDLFRRQNLSLRGYIDGLILSNDVDAAHDISIGVGEATLEDATEEKVLSSNASALVKQIDVNWALGTASGGFPSALTLSADTWYHVFAIGGSGGTIDAGFDTSLTAANLLADATQFTFFRRIGSVLTDSSANILAFSQFGDQFLWSDPPLDIDVTNYPTGVQTAAISVPTGLQVLAHLMAVGGGGRHYIHSPSANDENTGSEGTLAGLPATTTGVVGSSYMTVTTDSSAQIQYRQRDSDAGVGDINVMTIGWIDPRGRATT